MLRVLQEQEVERLGSARTIKVDVRVIAATNKNLEEAIERGEFREDLYFRLNVIPIVVPPLRERREDIPLLVQHFAEADRATSTTSSRSGSTPRAMEALQRYRWRGNIRELRNTVERLMIMTPGDVVRVEDLPADVRGDGASRPRRAEPVAGGASSRAGGPDRADAAARHAARVQGRRRARVSRREAAREQLEHLEDRRSASTRRAAISTRSSNSTGSSRKSTADAMR